MQVIAHFDAQASSIDLLILCGCATLIVCTYHVLWFVRKLYAPNIVTETARPFRNAGGCSFRPQRVNTPAGNTPPRPQANVVG